MMKLTIQLVAYLVALISPLLSLAEQKLVSGNNQFATELYTQLAPSDGNLFFSPYSVSSALAMTYAGARGATAEQMAGALHFPLAADKIAGAFNTLQLELNAIQRDGQIELAIANALYPQQGIKLDSAFTNQIESQFQAKVAPLDLVGNPKESATTINSWVADQTKGKISRIISPDLLDPLTRLILVNAIYFKGNWETPFKKQNTSMQPFNLPDGSKTETPMMHRTGEISCAATEDLSLVDLPYSGGRLSMTILLPNHGIDIGAIESKLSASRIGELIAKLEEREVQLAIPKFKIESLYELTQNLTALGMTAAFDPQQADFSGIFESPEQLYIGMVIHKAFIEVNEEGTEAAAATAVGIRATAIREPKPPVLFKADRPFLFLIRDRKSGSILFAGRLSDPQT